MPYYPVTCLSRTGKQWPLIDFVRTDLPVLDPGCHEPRPIFYNTAIRLGNRRFARGYTIHSTFAVAKR